MATEVLLTNYKILYDVDEKDEELCSLVTRNQGKKDYYIYKRICELALNSFVVCSENSLMWKLTQTKRKNY